MVLHVGRRLADGVVVITVAGPHVLKR